jgi:hypothetical protein
VSAGGSRLAAGRLDVRFALVAMYLGSSRFELVSVVAGPSLLLAAAVVGPSQLVAVVAAAVPTGLVGLVGYPIHFPIAVQVQLQDQLRRRRGEGGGRTGGKRVTVNATDNVRICLHTSVIYPTLLSSTPIQQEEIHTLTINMANS